MLSTLYRAVAGAAAAPPFPLARDSRSFPANLAAEGTYGDTIPAPESTADFLRVVEDIVVANRCATLNAQSVTVGTLRLYRPKARSDGKEEILPTTSRGADAQLLNFFRRPNPRTSGRRWLYLTQLWKESVGNAFSELVLDVRPLVQAWNMNAAATEVKATPRAGIIGYRYAPGGLGADVLFAPEQVWHDRFPTLSSDVYGAPPMRAARRNLTADEMLERAMSSVLKNGMRLSGVLHLDHDADPEQVQSIVDGLRATVSGVQNWGKTLVAPAGRKFEAFNMEPERFGASEFRKWNAGMIMRAYGIWPVIFGDVNESATRENATTQLVLYQGLTVAARARDMCDELSSFLIPALGIKGTEGVWAEMDFSDTPIMRQIAQEDARANSVLVERGILTQNDVRDTMGFDPVAWGDSFWANQSTVEVARPDGKREAQSSPPLPQPGKLLRMLRQAIADYGESLLEAST